MVVEHPKKKAIYWLSKIIQNFAARFLDIFDRFERCKTIQNHTQVLSDSIHKICYSPMEIHFRIRNTPSFAMLNNKWLWLRTSEVRTLKSSLTHNLSLPNKKRWAHEHIKAYTLFWWKLGASLFVGLGFSCRVLKLYSRTLLCYDARTIST